jgi:hypothetical protein
MSACNLRDRDTLHAEQDHHEYYVHHTEHTSKRLDMLHTERDHGRCGIMT